MKFKFSTNAIIHWFNKVSDMFCYNLMYTYKAIITCMGKFCHEIAPTNVGIVSFFMLPGGSNSLDVYFQMLNIDFIQSNELNLQRPSQNDRWPSQKGKEMPKGKVICLVLTIPNHSG